MPSIKRNGTDGQLGKRTRNFSSEIEWYTPRRYLDLAVEVMGKIDLDPASSPAAQDHVRAGRYFTVADNGLRQQWDGRIWLNPPYRMPDIRRFTEKMCSSWEDGDISQGIMLTNSAPDTAWYHRALQTATAFCLTRGRIRFLESGPDGLIERPAPMLGQTFFYFGRRWKRFQASFGQVGAVCARMDN